MRVIVTGATSFIGQAAVKELLRRGCQVTAVVRPDSPGLKAISRKPGVEVAALNLAEIRRLTKFVSQYEKEFAKLMMGFSPKAAQRSCGKK